MQSRVEVSGVFKAMAVAAALISAATAAPTGNPITLGLTGHGNAHPWVAADGRFAAIAWGAARQDGPTDVYVAISRDGGLTYASPVRVSDAQSRASLSGEQPPRVTLVAREGKEPSVLVVWTARAANGTRLLTARSDDGGRAFTRPTPVPGSDAPGNRGWEATASHPDGRVAVVWLDHRELAPASRAAAGPDQSREAHVHGATGAEPADGVARAQLSKLFFAHLDDTGSARAITGGVCYCCKTAVAVGPDGAIYAAWRHVYPGNVRDIAFTMSRDGGRTFSEPVRVSDDGWVLDGCPENGPAMVVDPRGTIHLVWPTLIPAVNTGSEATLGLFYSASSDGRRFSPRQPIPTDGFPRHPQIAMSGDGRLMVVWDEEANATRRVAAALSPTGGANGVRFTRMPIGGQERGEYPVVAGVEDGFVAVWTGGERARSVIQVERFSGR
jgi:hypothetical protein